MTKATLLFFALATILVVHAGATQVNDCITGDPIPDKTLVTMSNCDIPPCKIRKRTKVSVRERFTPDHDVNQLTTGVSAYILGVPLPFVGVDGTSACDKVFHASDDTPAPCPLKKGVEYVYKNEFPVLKIYPSVHLVIHWALRDGNKDVTCFKLPAEIV